MANARQFMAARTAAWAKAGGEGMLPRRVLYIESDSSQVIKIPAIPNDDRILDIGFSVPVPYTLNLDVFDNHKATTAAKALRINITSGMILLSGLTQYFKHKLSLLSLYRVKCDISTKQLYEDENLVSELSGSYILNNQELYLFDQSGSIRLFWFKLGNESTGINLLPYLDENGVPCLYDSIGDVYYYDENGGRFIYGE